MTFKTGNSGRPKGTKNKVTNDVRECFHKVYNEMGHNVLDDNGQKTSGHKAFLAWARENQTEFYRLYGKMIPATLELPEDILENFVDQLIFKEEAHQLVDGQANVVDVDEVGDKAQIAGPSGEPTPDSAPPHTVKEKETKEAT
jgi:hypothetical protein